MDVLLDPDKRIGVMVCVGERACVANALFDLVFVPSAACQTTHHGRMRAEQDSLPNSSLQAAEHVCLEEILDAATE